MGDESPAVPSIGMLPNHDRCDPVVDKCLENAIPIIPGRFLWAALPPKCERVPADSTSRCFVFTDEDYSYQQFFADFGPLRLDHAAKYSARIHLLLEDHPNKTIFHVCGSHPHRQSNSALLALTYAIVYLGKSAEEAFRPFFRLPEPLAPFRDAAFGVCTYQLHVLDCARAVARAAHFGHADLRRMAAADGDGPRLAAMARLENGDMTWIVPGKLLAFSGPLSHRREVRPGAYTRLAADYVPAFRRLGVRCVVRLNAPCYDRRRFIEAGIRHVDLFFEDGSNPSQEILQRFLQVCENADGAVAVHCKAGLGRTGTCISLYLMKHFGYSAAEAIALCRLCRPGCVVGPQQQFLQGMQEQMRTEGDTFRRRAAAAAAKGGAVTAGTGVSAADAAADVARGGSGSLSMAAAKSRRDARGAAVPVRLMSNDDDRGGSDALADGGDGGREEPQLFDSSNGRIRQKELPSELSNTTAVAGGLVATDRIGTAGLSRRFWRRHSALDDDEFGGGGGDGDGGVGAGTVGWGRSNSLGVPRASATAVAAAMLLPLQQRRRLQGSMPRAATAAAGIRRCSSGACWADDSCGTTGAAGRAAPAADDALNWPDLSSLMAAETAAIGGAAAASQQRRAPHRPLTGSNTAARLVRVYASGSAVGRAPRRIASRGRTDGGGYSSGGGKRALAGADLMTVMTRRRSSAAGDASFSFADAYY
ncbi:unnamed protein product, partial [Phaeothamnion confervicola]